MQTKTTISLTSELRVKLSLILHALSYEYINAYVATRIRDDWDKLLAVGRVTEEQLQAAIKDGRKRRQNDGKLKRKTKTKI